MCLCACARACVRARVRVRACMRVCPLVITYIRQFPCSTLTALDIADDVIMILIRQVKLISL